MVAEGLIEVQKNGVPILMGVEKGSGKNQTNAYACFKPNRALEAKNWIRKNFGTKFIIAGKKEHVTTLPKINKEEESCRNDLNDYILDRLKVITINENNRLKQKLVLK